MKESDFRQSIIEAATKLGWEHYHTHDSRRSDPGFPDDVLVHAGKKRVLFVEWKSDDGVVSPAQAHWHEILAACDEEVYVVRPKDFDEFIDILTWDEKPNKRRRANTQSAVVVIDLS